MLPTAEAATCAACKNPIAPECRAAMDQECMLMGHKFCEICGANEFDPRCITGALAFLGTCVEDLQAAVDGITHCYLCLI